MKYCTPLMKTVEYDDEENWFMCEHDEDDDNEDEYDETPVYLHSGKLSIPNRERLAEKMEEPRQFILEINSESILSKPNVVIESSGDVCVKVVTHNNKVK